MTTVPPTFRRPKRHLDNDDESVPAKPAPSTVTGRVLAAHDNDTTPVQLVTEAKLRKIGIREMGRGYRQGQRDLVAELGFDSADDLAAFVATFRDGIERR